jgi:nucleotide-binding universal stress UspA family protein
MFNRILVPLDGSPLAERAIPHASHFARIFGGNIILLQVLDPAPYRENASAVEPLNWQIKKTEADLYLKGVAERLREQKIQAEYILREGRAPENIVDYAQNEDINLIVLTTHGAGGLTRWNTSSVLTKVIDKVYLPVLIIRAYQVSEQNAAGETAYANADVQQPAPGNAHNAAAIVNGPSSGSTEVGSPRSFSTASIPMAGGSEMQVTDAGIRYHRILIPIDSSRRAECSLPTGIGLIEGEEKLHQSGRKKGQSEENATLVLTSVIKPPELPIPAPYPEELQQLSDRFMQISREAVREYISEIQARIPVKTEINIVENESVPSAIHDLVDKENIDLVVFCAHGKTGRNNWPYGSVSRNYIEHGTQPVLVIQDVPRSQVRPTSAEIAAKKYGRR